MGDPVNRAIRSAYSLFLTSVDAVKEHIRSRQRQTQHSRQSNRHDIAEFLLVFC